MISWQDRVMVSCAFAALCACGGGGGGSGGGGTGLSSTPAPPQATSAPTNLQPVTKPSNEQFDTAELQRSAGAREANVMPAWQAGATGKGITIGFVDSGLNPDNPELGGRVHDASRDMVRSGTPLTDLSLHGTFITGIAAASRNDANAVGVAYEATVFMARVDSGCPNSCNFDQSDIARGIDAARVAGASVLNLSFGGGAAGNAIIEAVKRAAAAGMVIVVGAGNSGSSASQFAQSLAQAAPLNTIIVGALGSSVNGVTNYDQQSMYSANAGEAARYYIGAPGWHVGTVGVNGGYDQVSGTSFSAPVVAGAAALLAQAFPNLTAQQIVSLLLTTADDIGTVGIDNVFGNGRLNIGRAFQPQGSLSLPDASAELSTSQNAMLPTAAGDAAQTQVLHVVALDDYQRAFTVDLAETIAEQSVESGMYNILSGDIRQVDLNRGPLALTASFAPAPEAGRSMPGEEVERARMLATTIIARLDTTTRIAMGVGKIVSAHGMVTTRRIGPALSVVGVNDVGLPVKSGKSIALSRRFGSFQMAVSAEKGQLALADIHAGDFRRASIAIASTWGDLQIDGAVSQLDEQDSVLGGQFNLAFGSAGGRTRFVDGGVRYSPGSLGFEASYRRAWTNFAGGAFTTDAFSAAVEFTLRENLLSLRASQPLRVSRGGIEMSVPVAWDYKDSSAQYAIRTLSFIPSGREIDFELGMTRKRGSASFNWTAYARRDPGHRSNASMELGMMSRLALSF